MKEIIHGFSATLVLILFIGLPASLSSAFSTQQASKVELMIEDFEDVVGRSFDYIIVGGGASGCPLAATLSERYSVLLVERGGSPYGNPIIEDKKNFGVPFIQTDAFTSVSQKFVSEEGVVNQRGRVLGGSTAINAGFYSRAGEEFIRRAGWDPELAREAYGWVESKMVFRPSLTAWQSVSADSMVEAGIRPFNGFSLEHIEGTKVGATIFDVQGRRHTAADVLASARNPNNIALLLNATVQNVIFRDAGDRKQPRAHGIRFTRSNGNPDKWYEVYLNRPNGSAGSWGDVILCAGALGSPQILMLSGIGPKQHLMHFNITPLVDARAVGQFMQDNPAIRIPLNYSSRARLRLHTDTTQVAGIANGFKFIVETSSSYPAFNTSIRVVLGIKIALPASRGLLRLVSVDSRQNPSVKFNYLAKQQDLDECVDMVRLLNKVARSKSITAFLEQRQSIIRRGGNGRSSYEELRDLCKEKVSTIYHYHGGCVVGSVVDRDYRVLGVRGLRVVDFSTFLHSPGTNPMATVLMLGRYQGVRMLREGECNSTTHPSESGN